MFNQIEVTLIFKVDKNDDFGADFERGDRSFSDRRWSFSSVVSARLKTKDGFVGKLVEFKEGL